MHVSSQKHASPKMCGTETCMQNKQSKLSTISGIDTGDRCNLVQCDMQARHKLCKDAWMSHLQCTEIIPVRESLPYSQIRCIKTKTSLAQKRNSMLCKTHHTAKPTSCLVLSDTYTNQCLDCRDGRHKHGPYHYA